MKICRKRSIDADFYLFVMSAAASCSLVTNGLNHPLMAGLLQLVRQLHLPEDDSRTTRQQPLVQNHRRTIFTGKYSIVLMQLFTKKRLKYSLGLFCLIRISKE